MKEEQKQFFEVLEAFRKINVSAILPDISHGDFGILKTIDYCRTNCKDAENGDVKVSALVRCTKLPAPTVSRNLRSLEEKGYIVRSIDKKDRRNTYVELTGEGEELLTEADGIMSDFADAVFGRLGEETLIRLTDYLRRLVDTATKEIEKRKYRGEKGDVIEDETHI